MNGNINPFNITYPTAVQTSLASQALFAKFDPTGRFVGAGCHDGSARVWDLDTKSAVRWLEGHVKGVTSMDFSRNSRYLLTASKDWNVCIWDLASDSDPPRRKAVLRFDAPVVSVSFHPRNSQVILVVLAPGEAYIVDLRKQHRGREELCEVQDENDSDDEGQSRSRTAAMTTAKFDPTGRLVFVGTSAGMILVFNTRTKQMIARHKTAGAGSLKGIEFAKYGRRLVTNSTDRTLRHFNLPLYGASPPEGSYVSQELEPTYRLNDPISKVAWHAMAYSPSGEWLAGGAADNANHKVYVWDVGNDGQFAAVLDGGREPLVHVDWHPKKPMIASTTNQGNILLWHCPTPERWGAFAGGFEEVDENVEYEEREDEFDIEDEADQQMRKQAAEEQEVDISTIDAEPNEDRYTYWGHRYGAGGEEEEDAAWADDEPDDDEPGWRMKVLMEDEDALM